MRRSLYALFLVALAAVAGPVSAAGVTYNTPPPASVIVVEGGLEWIWAAPCAAVDPSCGTPGPLPIQGFRVATDSEWAAAWTDRAELVAAFVIGGVAKCGSPWMSSFHDHCDVQDLQNGHIWHAFANGICNPSYFNGCEASTTETFLVRGARGQVPEPGTLALLGLGLSGLALRRRSRSLRA